MASLKDLSSRLTPKGRAKLAKITSAIKKSIEASLVEEGRTFLRNAAAIAPDEREEAEMLSRGTVVQGVPRRQGATPSTDYGVVGTPEGGRFLHEGTLSLRAAILDSGGVISRGQDRITLSVGSYADLNEKTGFSWSTKSRGIVGPTKPFDRKYAESMENGGVWGVTPRRDTPRPHALNPEDGVNAAFIVKILPPRLMFRQSRTVAATTGKAKIQSNVKAAARNASRSR